jgi:hypothetical protein
VSTSTGSEEAWFWHIGYGHLNFPVLWKLAREDIVRGLPELEHVDQVCSGYLVSKQHHTAFSRQAEYHAKDP